MTDEAEGAQVAHPDSPEGRKRARAEGRLLAGPPSDPVFMDEVEAALAADLYQAVQDMTNNSTRSQQSAEFRAGISDLGFCPERMRRMLSGQVEEETDNFLAWIGTALGDHAEQAWKAKWPEAIIQSEVTITHRVSVDGKQFDMTIPGHPDIILPDDGILLDGKTDYGLATIERSGPTRSHQLQRHQYGKAAWDAGLFADHIGLTDVRVGNCYIDRSGIEKRFHVNLEPLSMDWVEEARQELESVVHGVVLKEEVEKRPPRDMCAVVCGFFEECRALDTDAQGFIEDPELRAAVELYVDGQQMEKAGKALKDQAKVHLEGVEGSTGQHVVRWVHVNASEVQSFVKRGFDKIDIKPVKVPKAGKR